MHQHSDLPDAGRLTHFDIDLQLPDANQKEALVGTTGTPSAANKYVTADDAPAALANGRIIRAGAAKPDVTGARDTPEAALANLLTALAALGLITDSTTAT